MTGAGRNTNNVRPSLLTELPVDILATRYDGAVGTQADALVKSCGDGDHVGPVGNVAGVEVVCSAGNDAAVRAQPQGMFPACGNGDNIRPVTDSHLVVVIDTHRHNAAVLAYGQGMLIAGADRLLDRRNRAGADIRVAIITQGGESLSRRGKVPVRIQGKRGIVLFIKNGGPAGLDLLGAVFVAVQRLKGGDGLLVVPGGSQRGRSLVLLVEGRRGRFLRLRFRCFFRRSFGLVRKDNLRLFRGDGLRLAGRLGSFGSGTGDSAEARHQHQRQHSCQHTRGAFFV